MCAERLMQTAEKLASGYSWMACRRHVRTLGCTRARPFLVVTLVRLILCCPDRTLGVIQALPFQFRLAHWEERCQDRCAMYDRLRSVFVTLCKTPRRWTRVVHLVPPSRPMLSMLWHDSPVSTPLGYVRNCTMHGIPIRMSSRTRSMYRLQRHSHNRPCTGHGSGRVVMNNYIRCRPIEITRSASSPWVLIPRSLWTRIRRVPTSLSAPT